MSKQIISKTDFKDAAAITTALKAGNSALEKATDLEQKVIANNATTLNVEGAIYCDFKNIGKKEQGDLYNLTVKKGVTYTFVVAANDDISDQVGVGMKVITTGASLAYTILSADKKEDTITYTPTEDIANVYLLVVGNSDGCCSQVVVFASTSSKLNDLSEKTLTVSDLAVEGSVYTLDLTSYKCPIYLDFTSVTSGTINIFGTDEDGNWAYDGEAVIEMLGSAYDSSGFCDAATTWGSTPSFDSSKIYICSISKNSIVWGEKESE